MTAILGISAYYHDSAAALVVDGGIVAAAQEERFTRKKHDAAFPTNAVEYCLRQAGIDAGELDYVGFYEKPLTKFDRVLETWLSGVPRGYRRFRRDLPRWLKQNLHLPREIDRALGHAYQGRYVFPEHHESHAASAFFPSPFEEAAIVTFDGVGEWTTSSLGQGRGNRIELTHEQRFPHSLGLLYSAFTYYCGFQVNSGEYKLMGLAPYGKPTQADVIRNHLIDLKDDGSFRLDLSYFDYCHGVTMTSRKFHDLFGGPPRQPDTEISQRHCDLAASIQQVTDEAMLRTVRHAHELTGQKNLVMAGGVALNCVANGRILREGPFEQIWIQPAAGDAGGALGTALFIWHQLLNKPRQPQSDDSQNASLLGPEFDEQEVVAALDEAGIAYDQCKSNEDLCTATAEMLANGKVVGWFQGRMEFGPRALGSRSILADARNPEMQSVLNQKIKFRESFRPFAPIVLRKQVDQYFEMRPGEDSPYMLLVAPVNEAHRIHGEHNDTAGIHERLQQPRSDIPGVTHVDGTARVQTVDEQRHPLLHQLLTCFQKATGCGVLINTSFNVRDEPIVCSPKDAVQCFLATGMDALVIGNCVATKDRSQAPEQTAEPAGQYQLD